MGDSTDHRPVKPFARHGGEKMIYDVRMGPQAISNQGRVYIAYQAAERGPAAHPHVIQYDETDGRWSDAQQLGRAPYADHHFCPIIWMDANSRLHTLHNCHISGRAADPVVPVHLIGNGKAIPQEWVPGSDIAPSISYPQCVQLSSGRRLLYYRVFGHMGYWTYSVSDDGSDGWRTGAPLVDFDAAPQHPRDTWAGSYHVVRPGRDGDTLHVAFCYWDESQTYNRLYQHNLGFSNRYDLYYLKVNVETGTVRNFEGKQLTTPINRSSAESCRILDSGYHITNTPAMHIDASDTPSFLVPVSASDPWDCSFRYLHHDDDIWQSSTVTGTNSTWSGSYLSESPDGRLRAFLIAGADDDWHRVYGGGNLELWESSDRGAQWMLVSRLSPRDNLLFNNPRPVVSIGQQSAATQFVCYGWEGPRSIWENQLEAQKRGFAGSVNTGEAYLFRDGVWVDGR